MKSSDGVEMDYVVIKRAVNGWVLEHFENVDSEEDNKLETFVFSGGVEKKQDAEGFVSLLWTVKDIMGASESRYDEHRVTIGIEKGDKFEDKEN